MNNGLKIQRCNFLPEGEMTIIKDTNTLIHNIVDSELKEKDKEIERLKLELSGYREAILRNDELLGLQDYKSRCEKAIEYIKVGKTFDNEDVRKIVNKIQNDLLNILQGEEK